MAKPVFMGTTEVTVEKTAGEVTALLVQSGARQISTEYSEQQKPVGVSFLLLVNQCPYPFKLPVRVSPVFDIIQRQRVLYSRAQNKVRDMEQAERVAWRQLYRWLQAQLAMIQTNMVKAEEVFLPYIQDTNGQTLFEQFSETRFKALPAAPEVVAQ